MISLDLGTILCLGIRGSKQQERFCCHAHLKAFKLNGNFHRVSRGARDWGNNRSLPGRQHVQQAALARVWRPHNRYLDP
jgi:hypothetical protein